ncbi:membrane or secreted protein [Formosa sp. 4Alg 33]|uniref:membrane or secreted protein n=1 Tax=Formosa sp. 4Alg 33 TaxID=3382189 RepID=UPI003D9C3BB8
MKKYIGLLVCFCLSFGLHAQGLIGAWERYSTSEHLKVKHVMVYTDGYYVLTAFNANTGEFVSTTGGSWEIEGDNMTEHIEFDSSNSDRVGTTISYSVSITDSKLKHIESNTTFTQIDNGTPGALQGAWLMSGRVKDGTVQSRDTTGPRKTMKILSGTRFQWIAFNIETKEFKGTGGGTYTTNNGKYTENIAFFSKDNSKVGLSLSFNFELIDGNWHHSGKSSKGDPIHEVWSIRD